MRSFILAAALSTVALSGTASAQQPVPQPPRPPVDGVLTREAALARADQRFAAIDTDRDGRITAAERAALPQRGPRPAADGAAPPPPPGGPRRMGGGGMLERADANGDGVITREEFRTQAAAAFDRQDANRDGRVDPAERRQGRDPGADRRGGKGRHGGMHADANRDGVVTRAEFQAKALARFDRQDLNRDGRIDAAERQQLRERRSERRGQRAAG